LQFRKTLYTFEAMIRQEGANEAYRLKDFIAKLTRREPRSG